MSFFKNGTGYLQDYDLSFTEKICRFNYLYLLFISLVVGMGITVLYSVAGGHFTPWALKQSLRFFLSLSATYSAGIMSLSFSFA